MEQLNKSNPFYVKACIRLFLLALIIFFAVEGRELFIPLTIAIFRSFILLPVSQWLEHVHVPRALAIFFSILFAILVLGGFVFFHLYATAKFRRRSFRIKNKNQRKG